MKNKEAIESLYAHLLALRMDYVNCEDDEEREDAREIMNALVKAIKALEKQIPKKPKDKGGYNRCPGCANHVDMYYTNYSGTGDKVLIEYCPMCGQAIDWSEE